MPKAWNKCAECELDGSVGCKVATKEVDAAESCYGPFDGKAKLKHKNKTKPKAKNKNKRKKK